MTARQERQLLNKAVATVFAASLAFAGWSHGQTSLSVGNVPGYPGATVAVPVTLRQGGGAVAAQFDVTFNNGKVSALEALGGAQLTDHVIRSRQIAPGVERVLIYSLNNVGLQKTNVTVANVPFTLSPTEFVGSGPLTPSNLLLAKADATPLTPVKINSGAIFVRQVNRNQDGTVQFFLSSQADTRYLIQATTNFLNWENLTNTIALGDFMDLVDTDSATHPHRFYRSIRYDAIRGEIASVRQQPDGGLIFLVNALPGRPYTLQASPDLQSWTDLSNYVAVSTTLSFTNAMEAAFPRRFFRLKSP